MTMGLRLSRAPRYADVTLFGLGLVALIATIWGVLVFGSAGLPRTLALGAALLALVLTILWRRPFETLAWLPILMVSPEFLEVFAYELVVIPLMAFMLFYAHRKRLRWAFQLDPIEVVLLMFLGWCTFSVFWVRDSWWWVFGIRKLVVGFIALWVAWRWSRFVRPDIMLNSIVATSILLSLATVRQAGSQGWFTGVQHEHMRVQASDLGWGAGNYIAALLSMLLPTVINQAMIARNQGARMLGILGIPLSAMVVTIASSRGGFLLTLGIALFMVFRSRIKSWVLWVTTPLALSLLIFGPGAKLLLSRFQNVEGVYSAVVRLMFFREAWRRVVAFWPLGMGWNQGFGAPDRLYKSDPHNALLVIASELGLLGLVLWFTYLVLIYRRILKIARHPATRVEGQAIQITFWIIQVNSMFEPTIFAAQYFFLMNWIFGSYIGWAERVWAGVDPATEAMPTMAAAKPAPRIVALPHAGVESAGS